MLVLIFTGLLLFLLGTGTSIADDSGKYSVTFHLYRDAKHPYNLKSEWKENLSHFNLSQRTIFLIHGWRETGRSDWVLKAVRAYLSRYKCNCIAVNWSGSQKPYPEAVGSTTETGQKIAKLIRLLQKYSNLSLDDLHIVGHSLGAHVSSIVGYELKGEIGRITGLDPAGPLYGAPIRPGRESRLDPTDAKFVDIIHTNGWVAGLPNEVGHVDFYPNGGVSQNGCLLNPICNHQRSLDYMIESINDPTAFPALHCSGYVQFKLGACAASEVTFMGEDTSERARGKFYLDTRSQFPYGKRSL